MRIHETFHILLGKRVKIGGGEVENCARESSERGGWKTLSLLSVTSHGVRFVCVTVRVVSRIEVTSFCYLVIDGVV